MHFTRHKSFLIISLLCVITIITGCSTQTTTTSSDTQLPADDSVAIQTSQSLNIVTTIPPLYAHAASLIDDNDIVTNLVPPGSSVHFWQPRPSDVVAMQQADLIITNGLGLEEFLERSLSDLQDQGVVIVDTSAGIETIEFGHDDEDEDQSEHHDDEDHSDHEEHESDHDDEHDHTGQDHDDHDTHEEHNDDHHEEDEEHDDHHSHEHHHHEGPDPHIWLDPSNAIIQATTITQALQALDPSQTATYEAQLDEYTTLLEQTDTSIRSLLVNQDVQPFIVFHDAYQYFLQAYGLADAQVGLVQEFHGDNPSQRQIAELIQTIQDEGVQYVYTEPQFNPSVVSRLTQETGVQSAQINPLGDTLESSGYIDMITALAQAFIQ